MAAALCYGVRGGGAQLAFHVTAGNYDTDSLIQVLQELRNFLGGEKATPLWDGLPSHRSAAMRKVIDQAHRGIQRVRRTPHLGLLIPAARRPIGVMTSPPEVG